MEISSFSVHFVNRKSVRCKPMYSGYNNGDRFLLRPKYQENLQSKACTKAIAVNSLLFVWCFEPWAGPLDLYGKE